MCLSLLWYINFYHFVCVSYCFCFFQTMIKDPKLSGIVMNPHVKRNIKQKAFTDALTKAKLSPLTINLISEWSLTRANWPDFHSVVLFLSNS